MNVASRILAGVQEFAESEAFARQQMQGNEYTRKLLDDMLPQIAAFASDPEYRDDLPMYRRIRLIPLGKIPRDSFTVGNVICERSAYVGEDGKIYVEGPRFCLGVTVLDIHPYCVQDARGFDGFTADDVVQMALAYFI